MHPVEVHKTLDFSVYKQIIRGDFNPVGINKQISKSALCIVRAANTCVVYSEPTRAGVEEFISTADLTVLGYHSSNDIEITISQDPKSKLFQASIAPNKIYTLCEDISLPDPPDDKAKIFLDFISDEFERTKIRAEHLMKAALSVKKINSFACLNLQLLRKLFDDSRLVFYKMCSTNINSFDQSDLFILYILNLFIIRSLVFYTKFFRPYLNEEPLSDQELRNNFHNTIPLTLKFPWLFIHYPSFYDFSKNPDSLLKASEINPAYHKNSSMDRRDIPDSLLKEVLEFIELKGCIQLNCNKNVFLAEIFKMLHEKNYDGKGMFSTEKKKLIKLLSFIITDNEGNPLNPATINTVTKPSSIKKRPGFPLPN